jgi:hypothetical protein
VTLAFRPRIKRTRSGRYKLHIPDNERDVLRALPGQLRALLAGQDDLVYRLFPPAYIDDAPRDEEYHAMVRDDLMSGHLANIEAFEETLDAEELSDEQIAGWLGALNDLRLVLGTRLDVTEEMDLPADDDPDAGLYAVYAYLGWLQEQVVEAMSVALPPPTEE